MRTGTGEDGSFWVEDDNGWRQVDAAEYSNVRAAAETSPLEAAGLQFGRTMAGAVRGAGQLVGADIFPWLEQARPQGEALAAEHPIATTLGAAGAYAPAALIPGGLAAQTAIGAGLGYIDTEAGGSALERAAWGGGVTAGFGGIAAAARAIRNGSFLARGPAAGDVAEGVTPTTGQRLDNPELQFLENRAAAKSRGGIAAAEQMERVNNAETFTRMQQAMDVPVDMPARPGITREVLEQVEDGLGAQYDALMDTLPDDIPVTAELDEAFNRFFRSGPSQENVAYALGLPDIPENLANIDKWALRDIRTKLGQGRISSDTVTRGMSQRAIEAIDDAFEAVAPPNYADDIATVRDRFSALYKMQDSLNSDGIVSAKRMSTRLDKRLKGQRGRSPEMQAFLGNVRDRAGREAGRAGGPLLGGSQTAPRTPSGGIGATMLDAAVRNRGLAGSIRGDVPGIMAQLQLGPTGWALPPGPPGGSILAPLAGGAAVQQQD